MISGRQYYEIPPAGGGGSGGVVIGGGGGGTRGGAGNHAMNGHGSIHRFDPTYVPGYGHGVHGYSRGHSHGGGGYYDRNRGTRVQQYDDDDNDDSNNISINHGFKPAPAARQSLSALDEKRANEIRRGVYAHVFLDVKNSSKSEVS
ncbi:hypothetical protein K4K49_003153 [Colletotrichum sp. SAR 10_70]|nr:hypothetical protein K4K50_011197 [Colletotrichum sp. SAR 10_71]KAI8199421.1 hypothetical protein K4K49_003153 [Colletotrichum sp. SAR 10_70]